MPTSFPVESSWFGLRSLPQNLNGMRQGLEAGLLSFDEKRLLDDSSVVVAVGLARSAVLCAFKDSSGLDSMKKTGEGSAGSAVFWAVGEELDCPWGNPKGLTSNSG